MNKKKLLILTFIIYTLGISAFFINEIIRSRQIIFSNVDAKLRSSTISLNYIVPERIHYLAQTGGTLNPEADRYNTVELSRYARDLGITYLYSFVLINDKVYFTASSANNKEISTGAVYSFMTEYDEASKELKDLFKKPNSELVEVTKDRWGYFRSILKSHIGYNGQIYVTGADMEVGIIKKLYLFSLTKSILLAISLLIIIVPIISQYEKINRLQLNNRISQKKLMRMEFDETTGLPYIEKLWVEKSCLANPVIFIIGINNLKTLSTHYGNEVVEIILKYLSEIISNIFLKSPNLKVYKLGLDEFVILMNEEKNLEELYVLGEHIFNVIYNRPFVFKGEKIIINPIIASSCPNGEILDLKSAFLQSRIALNYAYEKKLRVFIFNPSTSNELASVENEIFWTQKLWEAINENRIQPFFQGILNIKTGKIEKYEALMRLYEKNGKILSPYSFINISHKTGLYFKLSENMLRNSFNFFEDKNVEFSVNISAKDISDENTKKMLIKKVQNFPKPELIVFEIIESEGIDDFEEIINFIKIIRAFGCKIALDDFGSGYSNFERISKLPLDYIKIDGSLIKNLDTNKHNELLVQMIVKFSKKLNIKTIAEFVHSENIYKKIKEMGIDYAQGYYISEPLPELLPDTYSIEE